MGKKPTFFQYTKKRAEKSTRTTYRPILLLPICGKIFEKVIFRAIYKHLIDNQLLTPDQSGFHPGDSTIKQLLYITHRIYAPFEEFPSREARAVFLDISKAFDKIWYDSLILKTEKLWHLRSPSYTN